MELGPLRQDDPASARSPSTQAASGLPSLIPAFNPNSSAIPHPLHRLQNMSLLRSISASYCLSSLGRPVISFRPRFPRNVRCNSSSSASRPRIRVGSYIWYTVCFSIGIGLGYQVKLLACPPPQPIPGSTEDHLALQSLASQIDSLDIVKSLRAEEYHLHSDTPLTDSARGKSGWRELEIKNIISDDAGKGSKSTRTLTQESMAGARGLGVQRAFWNPITKEVVAVLWSGSFLQGWPGLTHGGAIATIFDEVLTRVVAGPDRSLGAWPVYSTHGAKVI